jgi:hypothetical protein
MVITEIQQYYFYGNFPLFFTFFITINFTILFTNCFSEGMAGQQVLEFKTLHKRSHPYLKHYNMINIPFIVLYFYHYSMPTSLITIISISQELEAVCIVYIFMLC